jgi:hypothetical protein
MTPPNGTSADLGTATSAAFVVNESVLNPLGARSA